MPRPMHRFTARPGQCAGCGLLDFPEHPVTGPHPLALCSLCRAERAGVRTTHITSAACDHLASALIATPGTSED